MRGTCGANAPPEAGALAGVLSGCGGVSVFPPCGEGCGREISKNSNDRGINNNNDANNGREIQY